MIANLIQKHAAAEAAAGDFDAVAATLSANTVAVQNTKSWTMADLINLVGPESAALIGGTIQAAGATNPIFAGAWIAFNVTGLQLHTAERQAMIDGLATAGNWSTELRAAVKAAGITYTSLAGTVVTAEQCSEAWESNALSQQWATEQNERINPASSDRAALVAALRKAADTLEVG